MKKTAKEWFDTLPEPYRAQAIANTEPWELERIYYNASSALLNSFLWEGTKQGSDYWNRYTLKLEKKKNKIQ